MDSSVSNDLTEFKCCKKYKPDHFLERPQLLYCGHYVCLACSKEIEKDYDELYEESDFVDLGITCSKCDDMNYVVDFDDVEKSFLESIDLPKYEGLENEMKANLKELAEATCSKLNEIQQTFSDEIQEIYKKIENQFEFMGDEIEIRVESLKAKVEEFGESLRKKLNDAKDKMKGFIMKEFNKEDLVDDLKMFEENIQKHKISMDTFNNYNRKFLELNDELERLKEFDYTAELDLDEKFKFNESEFGSFVCSYSEWIKKLNKATYKYIELKYPPVQVEKLKNGNFLVAGDVNKPAALYNENFEYISDIKEVMTHVKSITSFCCDSAQNLYMITQYCDVIKYDKDLKFVKSSELDRSYSSVCICDDKIYAVLGCSVDVFDLDLKLITTHYLKSSLITQIRVLNNTACVQVHNHEGILKTRFYALPSFKLLCEHSRFGPILAHDNWFLIYHKGFSAYNTNGRFVKSIADKDGDKRFFGDVGNFSSFVSLIDNKIYICLEDGYITRITLK